MLNYNEMPYLVNLANILCHFLVFKTKIHIFFIFLTYIKQAKKDFGYFENLKIH